MAPFVMTCFASLGFFVAGIWIFRSAHRLMNKLFQERYGQILTHGTLPDFLLPFGISIKGWRYIPGTKEQYEVFLEDALPVNWTLLWFRFLGILWVVIALALPFISLRLM